MRLTTSVLGVCTAIYFAAIGAGFWYGHFQFESEPKGATVTCGYPLEGITTLNSSGLEVLSSIDGASVTLRHGDTLMRYQPGPGEVCYFSPTLSPSVVPNTVSAQP